MKNKFLLPILLFALPLIANATQLVAQTVMYSGFLNLKLTQLPVQGTSGPIISTYSPTLFIEDPLSDSDEKYSLNCDLHKSGKGDDSCEAIMPTQLYWEDANKSTHECTVNVDLKIEDFFNLDLDHHAYHSVSGECHVIEKSDGLWVVAPNS